MRKLSLNVESLSVQSFETTEAVKDARGTVLGNAQTQRGPNCGDTSIADACVTGLCTGDCPTYDAYQCTALCPESYNDACPSGRGCTTISPC